MHVEVVWVFWERVDVAKEVDERGWGLGVAGGGRFEVAGFKLFGGPSEPQLP